MLNMPISILLMAQEPTKGIKSFGPKILLDVNNKKKIIDYHIENFIGLQKSANIITSIGFDGEKIKKYLLRITKNKKQINNTLYCKDYAKYNEGYIISEYLKHYPDTERLLIVPAGILFKPNAILYKHINKKSTIFLLNKYNDNFNTGCSIQNDQIKYMFFDLEHCWAECIYLTGKALSKLKQIIMNSDINNRFIFEIVNMLLEYNIEFDYQIINSTKFIKINNTKELAKAKRYS